MLNSQQKKLRSEKSFGLTKYLVQRNFLVENIFWVQKLWLKKILDKKTEVEKIKGKKKNLC